MKKCIKLLSLLVMAVTLVAVPSMNANASAKSNAAKMVKYYRAKKYTKASKYGSKLSDKVSIPKMTSKMKKAFRKKVKSYNTVQDYSKSNEGWIKSYYLADLDGDKKAELLVKYGTCEADYRTDIYKYKGGKAKLIKTVAAGHTCYIAYPGHTGILVYWGHMGGEGLSILQLKNNKLVSTGIGSRIVNYEKGEKSLTIKGFLNGHVTMKYDSKEGRYNMMVDYSDLR